VGLKPHTPQYTPYFLKENYWGVPYNANGVTLRIWTLGGSPPVAFTTQSLQLWAPWPHTLPIISLNTWKAWPRPLRELTYWLALEQVDWIFPELQPNSKGEVHLHLDSAVRSHQTHIGHGDSIWTVPQNQGFSLLNRKNTEPNQTIQNQNVSFCYYFQLRYRFLVLQNSVFDFGLGACISHVVAMVVGGRGLASRRRRC
jgi:hypothetical protein